MRGIDSWIARTEAISDKTEFFLTYKSSNGIAFHRSSVGRASV